MLNSSEETPQSFQLSHFTDIKKIGSGKFGKVFSAVEIKSGVKVALKVVYKDLLDQYDFYSQMKKELEIQYRLSEHPNIVKMHAYFYDKNCIFSVLEYAEEGNLYQKLKRLGKGEGFPEDIARKIIQQLIAALWYCQERNVIHRDIKPENILVIDSRTWHIKLCDFGWSTHTINQSRSTFCGTPDYLAPELVKKTELSYDYKIDNWAAGILAYELLTGASPFAPLTGASSGQGDIYKNIQNVDLCYNKIYETKVSDSAKDFISQILIVDPIKRLDLRQISEHPWLN